MAPTGPLDRLIHCEVANPFVFEWYLWDPRKNTSRWWSDVRRSEKHLIGKEVLQRLDRVAPLWRGGGAQGTKCPPRAQTRLGHYVNYCKAKSVELTGFEPVTPSLRNMRSNACDQGKRRPSGGL